MASILQPYRGIFVSAPSASTKLDLDQILAGCTSVENEASNIDELSNSVSSLTSNLGANIFSIDGKTVSPSSDKCCEEIIDIQKWIFDTTSQIRENAINAYNQLQTQLNNDAQNRDRYEINRFNNSRR